MKPINFPQNLQGTYNHGFCIIWGGGFEITGPKWCFTTGEEALCIPPMILNDQIDTEKLKEIAINRDWMQQIHACTSPHSKPFFFPQQKKTEGRLTFENFLGPSDLLNIQ